VLLPLAVLGGLGLPVLMELFDLAFRRRPLSAFSRTALGWTGGVYIAGVGLLVLLQWPFGDGAPAWQHAVTLASRQTLNARSAGFPFDLGPPVVQWATVLLMIVGACPGGTAGGVKVTTVAVLTGGTRRLLRSNGESGIGNRTFGIAIVWLAIYLLMLIAATLTLVATEPQMHADRLLFLAASALGNVGLSHDPVSLSETGWYVISATMLLGRITPVLVLWWIAETGSGLS
jgi:trk system potassium uptake protein TrkH